MIFRRRKPSDEFEGWWEPLEASPSPKLHGKIEWEPSLEGGTEIDLLVSKVDVPDGAEVEVVCDGEVVLRAAVQRGKARALIKSSDGHTIPDLRGRRVELRHGGVVLAATVLEPD